ncbi:uncharacterized protein UV8b_00428 [Ustilaginoidea virens]|uniref:Uncharacterized protein n=1 Tax=Ustilaginoidea virens TaxID=1159556 RepID=A0A063BN21_USTVR|nr:uncharacterized protein UV8b_00428 [Ustilaginoidea virens]QUC16187.1 hypothetical protein UV8b_00428 [Ustilaginoidea virens]GAO19476.1 hypothetical protein UVI_02027320 [Ustilaginoidea virens]
MKLAEMCYGIKKIWSPTAAALRDAFERLHGEDVDEYYDSYARGALIAYDSYEPPTLEIVHSSDIRVYYSNMGVCKCHNDINIERVSRDWLYNFMGYNEDELCYVFAGQRRLFDEFLKRTASLIQEGKVEMAYVRPRALQVPLEGLNPGLDYEQFASHIKTLDCILFLVPSLRDPLKLDALASTGQAAADLAVVAEVTDTGRYALRRRKSTVKYN